MSVRRAVQGCTIACLLTLALPHAASVYAEDWGRDHSDEECAEPDTASIDIDATTDAIAWSERNGGHGHDSKDDRHRHRRGGGGGGRGRGRGDGGHHDDGHDDGHEDGHDDSHHDGGHGHGDHDDDECVVMPPPEVPEAPQVLMLSASAALTGGTVLFVLRRRTRSVA